MTVLSDQSIQEMCSAVRNEPLIWPFTKSNLQPASYDVTLDRMLVGDDSVYFDYTLKPGEFILANTIEKFNIPPELVARLEGKSTWARRGLIIHTAGFVDPGFRGQLTLEMTNLSKKPLPLKNGMVIAQIAFNWLDRPANVPYGTPVLNSHYQGQEGPTPAHAG